MTNRPLACTALTRVCFLLLLAVAVLEGIAVQQQPIQHRVRPAGSRAGSAQSRRDEVASTPPSMRLLSVGGLRPRSSGSWPPMTSLAAHMHRHRQQWERASRTSKICYGWATSPSAPLHRDHSVWCSTPEWQTRGWSTQRVGEQCAQQHQFNSTESSSYVNNGTVACIIHSNGSYFE